MKKINLLIIITCMIISCGNINKNNPIWIGRIEFYPKDGLHYYKNYNLNEKSYVDIFTGSAVSIESDTIKQIEIYENGIIKSLEIYQTNSHTEVEDIQVERPERGFGIKKEDSHIYKKPKFKSQVNNDFNLIKYYPNGRVNKRGKLKWFSDAKDGYVLGSVLDGLSQELDENGNVISETEYKKGKKYLYRIIENGKVISEKNLNEKKPYDPDELPDFYDSTGHDF